MRNANRTLLVTTMLLLPVLLYAEGAADDERGWSFSQRFSGSSNYAGVVLKTNSTATYSFNQHLKTYAGFPVYFTRESSSTTNTHFVNGMGNVYAGFLVTAENSAIHYSSDLVGTAPTGDRSRGFSTGHATVDWTNTFSHSFNAVTPFASVGLANTISDASFFVRPFSSKGIVSHFESGVVANIAPHVSAGASGYAVRAAGEQQIISKLDEPAPAQSGTSTTSPSQSTTTTQQSSPSGIISTIAKRLGVDPASGTSSTGTTGSSGTGSTAGGNGIIVTQQEIIGPAAVANDHGFSTWMTLRPSRTTDLQIGYSRSVAYQFNSVFFGIGFRVGH